jgi:predicted anti-sigma-YlaC factor YlaD
MSCDAWQELMQQRLDGTPVESPELIDHLRSCSGCRELESAVRRLEAGLHLLSSPVPSPELAARIADRVLLDRRRRHGRARRRWYVSLAIAAGLLLALAFRLDWRRGSDRPDADRNAPVAHKESPAVAPTDTLTLRESAAEASAAVASLTSHTAGETMESTRRLVPRVSGASLPQVNLESIEPPTRPLREAREGVSAGLEPVADSARRAVGLFLRELPPIDEGQKGL